MKIILIKGQFQCEKLLLLFFFKVNYVKRKWKRNGMLQKKTWMRAWREYFYCKCTFRTKLLLVQTHLDVFYRLTKVIKTYMNCKSIELHDSLDDGLLLSYSVIFIYIVYYTRAYEDFLLFKLYKKVIIINDILEVFCFGWFICECEVDASYFFLHRFIFHLFQIVNILY